jgi:high-affinity Fe2+/Pb2+ permease
MPPLLIAVAVTSVVLTAVLTWMLYRMGGRD